MAKKETSTIEVHFQNDWFSGAKLYRKVHNPHILPDSVVDKLPSSAKIMKDGKLVDVEDVRNIVEDDELAETEKKEATVVVPPKVNKGEIKL